MRSRRQDRISAAKTSIPSAIGRTMYPEIAPCKSTMTEPTAKTVFQKKKMIEKSNAIMRAVHRTARIVFRLLLSVIE